MRYLSTVISFLFTQLLNAQSVGVGTISPQPSAMLEVSSNSKGFLPPRMTYSQIKAISNPSTGLMVYDTEFRCLRVFDGADWQALKAADKNINDPAGDFAAWNSGDGNITPLTVKFDQQGNIIVGGYFSSQIVVGGVTINGSGLDDIFLFKYSPSGQLIWYKTFGGNLNDEGSGVAVDGTGNIYLTGAFQSASITIGSTVLNNVQAGKLDLFLAKFDPSGNLVWANSAGGNGDELMLDAGLDAAGNIYVCGLSGSDLWAYGPNLIFGSLGDRNILLAKYNAAGTVIWSRSAGGSAEERAQRLAVDVSGNCYLTGFFQSSTIGFGGSVLAVNSGGQDMYIVKYDPNGTALWVKTGTGSGNEWGFTIATDPSGNVLAGGIFISNTLVFQGTTLTNTSAAKADAYIIKCDGAGNAIWVNSLKGNQQDYLYSITTDASGSIYLGGFTSSSLLDFNGAFAGPVGANSEAFFAKLQSNGQAVWAKLGGGTFDDIVYSVAVNSNGSRICATGEYVPNAKFGSQILTTGSLLIWLYGE